MGRKTAVQDTLNRLWWWENNMSCAYRNADGSSLQFDGYHAVRMPLVESWQVRVLMKFGIETCTRNSLGAVHSISTSEVRC